MMLIWEIFCGVLFGVGLLGMGFGVQRSDGILAVCGVGLMIVAFDWRFCHKADHDPSRGH